MMTERLYIDDVDVYSAYGMYILDQGYNDLVAMPPLKDVESNDWQEDDGIEADLSEPLLDSRNVTLRFVIIKGFASCASLVEALSDGAYHEFRCESIGRVYNLRLVSHPEFSTKEGLQFLEMTFADDFPLADYEYVAPESSIPEYADYTLDGNPFTDYGVRILEGTLDDIKRMPDVKLNLLTANSVTEGVTYDSLRVTYQAKDVRLYGLMRASTLSELWQNWDALLHDLVQPDERILGVQALGDEYPFYYKSCQVTRFYPTGKIWLEFVLNITITSNVRAVVGGGVVLATENGLIVITEDGKAIDMQPN